MTRKLSHVKVSIDKGNLRIQLSRSISREIFGVKQKYLYLKMNADETNNQIAQGIAIEIENDINAKKLQKDLSYYLPSQKLKKEVGIAYDPHKIEISLINLFDLYVESILRPNIAVTTYVLTYQRRYRTIFEKAPQNLNQQDKIINYFYQNCCGEVFADICPLLTKMINWGKNNNYINKEASNQVAALQKDYKVILGKYRPPEFLYEYIPGYIHDYDYKAFTAEEAQTIITSFEEFAEQLYFPTLNCEKEQRRRVPKCSQKTRKTARDFVKLKFWTGCRTCEASALRWIDIDRKNFEYIIFRNSYSSKLKLLKPLKTEKPGLENTESRKFPCGEKLSILLEEMYKNSSRIEDDFLFKASRTNGVFVADSLARYWYGTYEWTKAKGQKNLKYFKPGIVAKLLQEGKLFQYLKPYCTRHTWIVHQLSNGIPVHNVAKLAGNSPITIMNNYASYIPSIPLAPEI